MSKLVILTGLALVLGTGLCACGWWWPEHNVLRPTFRSFDAGAVQPTLEDGSA